MHKVYLGLGSNLGRRKDNLRKARKLLEECGVRVKKESKIYETKAVSRVLQPDFMNQCVEVATEHDPKKLLKIVQLIEGQIGRKRTEPKRKDYEKPRIIDIDILIFDDLKIDEPRLKIPHPQMKEREFVLKPLNDIAPQIVNKLN